MCVCKIVPVLTDAEARGVIRSKQDFQKKLKDVMKTMKGTVSTRCKF